MRLRFLGTGDAFASGGRYSTCILVERLDEASFLLDCGASAMTAMRRFGVDPNAISTILVSHLHGDHFGGLPFFLIDAHWSGRRTAPLTIVGPPGLEARLRALTDAMYAGFASERLGFELRHVPLLPGASASVADLNVRAFAAEHPSGAPSLCLRVACDGHTLAFTGDTEWTEELPHLACGADLLISECCHTAPSVPHHLDLETLRARRADLDAARIVLTHMGEAMLASLPLPDFETAEDGMALEIGARQAR